MIDNFVLKKLLLKICKNSIFYYYGYITLINDYKVKIYLFYTETILF